MKAVLFAEFVENFIIQKLETKRLSELLKVSHCRSGLPLRSFTVSLHFLQGVEPIFERLTEAANGGVL